MSEKSCLTVQFTVKWLFFCYRKNKFLLPFEIEFYSSEDGREPVAEFFGFSGFQDGCKVGRAYGNT